MIQVPSDLVYATLALLAGSLVSTYLLFRAWRAARRELKRTRSRKASQSTRYGQLTEQFAPWMAAYPFDPEGFRSLGDPIDGVQFTEDAVYLVEIKSATSRLSKDQRRIRELVAQGRVGWVEFRIDTEKGADVREPWR